MVFTIRFFLLATTSVVVVVVVVVLLSSCIIVSGESNDTTHRQRNLRMLGSPIGNFVNKNDNNGLNVRQEKKCPPSNFDALQIFDLDSYISASWYAVKQIPLSYQPIEDFYCVRADYIRDTTRCLFCRDSPKVQVYNQARNGSVNGTIGGTPYDSNNPPKEGLFRAFQRKPETDPAKLTVGFFSNYAFRANYWIVAAGTYEDAILRTGPIPSNNTILYEWAIITGGLPDQETENGYCIPNSGILDFLGMWMFTRDPVPPDGVIDGIDVIAMNMGLDSKIWLPVQQDGCVFNG